MAKYRVNTTKDGNTWGTVYEDDVIGLRLYDVKSGKLLYGKMSNNLGNFSYGNGNFEIGDGNFSD